MNEYYMPTKVEFGDRSLGKLGDIGLKGRGRLFLGRHSWDNGDLSKVLEQINGNRLDVIEVRSNPDISFYDAQIEIIKHRDYRFVIGMGGGSVMDVGKVVAYAANKTKRVMDLMANGTNGKGLTYVAIPTTAGTGSEVTMWATVWDHDKKRKLSLSRKAMYPDYAIVDPELTSDLPPRLIAETGMDALSQAVEAFWAIASNPTSDDYAREAIPLIMDNIVKRYQAVSSVEDNLEARTALSLGSLTAGRAFSNTRTTGVHSVSYPLTLRFNVSHGRSVGMLLPAFIDYNFKHIGYKAKELEGMGVTSERIREMLKEMEMPTRLSEVGVTEGDIPLLASESYTPGRVDNNPRDLTGESLRNLLLENL